MVLLSLGILGYLVCVLLLVVCHLYMKLACVPPLQCLIIAPHLHSHYHINPTVKRLKNMLTYVLKND